MPAFNLIKDKDARRLTRIQCQDSGVAIDLVYPFTLSGRSLANDFAAQLDAAAELEAESVNVLLYDRDGSRRLDTFLAFCEMANSRELKVAVEFYPPSQVATLQAASALARDADRPGKIGITIDLLHLMRSGGSIADIAAVPSEQILMAQLCDGPANVPAEEQVAEAANERALPGSGVFDLVGFVAALPPSVRLTVEIPQEGAIKRGLTAEKRVDVAVAAVRRAVLAPQQPSFIINGQ